MKKLSPSVKLRKEVSEFIERLQDVDSAEDVLTQLVQLSTQLITQEGLEAHQRDHLGVDRYERGEGRRGYRSGYEPGYLDTAEGRLEFLRDLDRRGLPTPLFITTDGAGGLIQAVDQMWSKSLRGRCWVHRMRNFASKVPKSRWHEIDV